MNKTLRRLLVFLLLFLPGYVQAVEYDICYAFYEDAAKEANSYITLSDPNDTLKPLSVLADDQNATPFSFKDKETQHEIITALAGLIIDQGTAIAKDWTTEKIFRNLCDKEGREQYFYKTCHFIENTEGGLNTRNYEALRVALTSDLVDFPAFYACRNSQNKTNFPFVVTNVLKMVEQDQSESRIKSYIEAVATHRAPEFIAEMLEEKLGSREKVKKIKRYLREIEDYYELLIELDEIVTAAFDFKTAELLDQVDNALKLASEKQQNRIGTILNNIKKNSSTLHSKIANRIERDSNKTSKHKLELMQSNLLDEIVNSITPVQVKEINTIVERVRTKIEQRVRRQRQHYEAYYHDYESQVAEKIGRLNNKKTQLWQLKKYLDGIKDNYYFLLALYDYLDENSGKHPLVQLRDMQALLSGEDRRIDLLEENVENALKESFQTEEIRKNVEAIRNEISGLEEKGIAEIETLLKNFQVNVTNMSILQNRLRDLQEAVGNDADKLKKIKKALERSGQLQREIVGLAGGVLFKKVIDGYPEQRYFLAAARQAIRHDFEGMAATLQSGAFYTSLINREKSETVPQVFYMAAEIAEAESTEDVVRAMRRNVLPVDYYKLKYKSGTVTLSSHIGYIYNFRETISETDHEYKSHSAMATFGVDLNYKRLGMSVTIFDMLQPINTQIDDSDEVEEKYTFESILAPGISFWWAFWSDETPLIVGVSYSQSSKGQTAVVDGKTEEVSESRTGAFIALDIPMFPLY